MKAFTLLEVLLALVFFSIGAVGIYSLLNQSLRFESWVENRLQLLFDSTEFITLAQDESLEPTGGWVEMDGKNIDAYKITEERLPFFNIIKTKVAFRKADIEIEYELYHQ